MFQAPRSSRMVRQCLALAVGTALSASLGVSPAHAAVAEARASSNTRMVAAELPLPDKAFEYSALGAGVGVLSALAFMAPLGVASRGDLVSLLTLGSFSTLAGALGSSAGHFYAGEPLRGLGFGVLGTGLITGASLGGMLVSSRLSNSPESLAIGAFVACSATLVGWTRFTATDAQNVAAQRGGAPSDPFAP